MHSARSIPRFAATVAVAVVCLAGARVAAAQSIHVGLSAVRAQRFGNDDLSAIFTPQTANRFADSLAAGDFNGDGADDLATGMPLDDGLAANPLYLDELRFRR